MTVPSATRSADASAVPPAPSDATSDQSVDGGTLAAIAEPKSEARWFGMGDPAWPDDLAVSHTIGKSFLAVSRVSGPSDAKATIGISGTNGSLPPEVVLRSCLEKRELVRQCYQAGLKRNPSLAGRVSARMAIDASGKVSEIAHRKDDDLADDEATSCVLDALAAIKFPAPTQTPSVVRCSFTFRRGDAR